MYSEGDFPSVQINRAKMILKSYFDKKAAELGITGPQVPYIALIAKSGEGITQIEATRILGYDKANSSRVMSELENKQLIEKITQDKRTLIRLTSDGQEIAGKIREITQKWYKTSFEGIDKKDIEVFRRVKKKMLENCMKAIEEKL
ncbi:MAG: MarR family winged helix-turn-helix transcriptional regulator [Christensenellaceae bacterium]|jgi:DNA-binding MarR family transcriptional regulator|nr:MarR family winged helix-turn-helix transcriptional regulator [Christensenellaceae bacterium]